MIRSIPALLRTIAPSIVLFGLALNVFGIGFDLAFGSSGRFLATFGDTGQPSSSGSNIYVQPSGRIVVLGRHQQQGGNGRVNGIAMVGLTFAGVLDSGFGSSGKVLQWSSDANQQLVNSAMLPNGAILLFYQYQQNPSTNRPTLSKFTPDGQPDETFSANLEINPNQTTAVIMASAKNGKIYALVREGPQYFLMRLNDDGSRDATFGPDGVRTMNLSRFPSPTIFGMDELPNGKLLITGHYENSMFERIAFAVRFDSDTNIDRWFGSQGVTRIGIPYGNAYGTRTLIQPDGKTLFVGFNTFLGSHAMLARLTARGRRDSGFGTNGVSLTSINDINAVYGVVLAPDGKIFVTGACGAKAIPSNQRMFIARFSSSGVRETFLVTDFITGRDAGGADIALLPNGKLLTTGFTQNPNDNYWQLAVAQFLP
jgi:uncharacterized delta-60 repeat protein